MRTPLITFEKVSFRYHTDQQYVVRDLSFTVDQDEFVSFVGPNGSGKTTVLRLLLGLEYPQKGKVAVEDRVIGYVPQRIIQEDLTIPFTVQEMVETGRAAHVGLFRFFKDVDHQAVTSALKLLDLETLRDRRVQELSGGQRQRVYIARALAGDPKLLILDEPTVGVDAKAQEQFYRFLQHIRAEKKMTVLFVTHDIDVVSALSDRVICMNNQCILCDIPASKFKKDQYVIDTYGPHHQQVHHTHR
ncbi:MAG: metal ABC transporter ATP-binding protein [Patescibacteria group bacterium]